MASASLAGMLSSGIGNLSHLQTLLLQNNQLSGPIPAEIGKLLNLRTLDISGNQLIGEIPSSLGFLTHLSYFFSGSSAEMSYLDRSLNLLLISLVFLSWTCHSIISVVQLQKF